LTPSSTVPSTRLVIIWLKRWLARPPIDPPLELAPVGVGVGLGEGEGVGVGVGVGEGLGVGVGVGVGVCADAGTVCAAISTSETAAVSAAGTTKLQANLAIVSARTACRWDRCRHRGEALGWRPQIA
jgi:hypothetical protein